MEPGKAADHSIIIYLSRVTGLTMIATESARLMSTMLSHNSNTFSDCGDSMVFVEHGRGSEI